MANSELLSAANKQAPGFGCGLLQTLAIHSREFLLLKQLQLVNSGMYLIHFTFKFLFLHIIWSYFHKPKIYHGQESSGVYKEKLQ